MVQCKKCGAGLRYDIKSKKMVCDNCSSTFEVKNVTASTCTLFRCTQCGGEIYGGDNIIAGFCSFCGSSTVIDSESFEGEYPESIVPFTVTKEQCKNSYESYIKKLAFVPKEFKELGRYEEFRGIYVPYHSYEVEVKGDYICEVKSDVRGKLNNNSRMHNVTINEAYERVNGTFTNIVHDASSTFNDEISELISSNGSVAAVDFNPAYLSGFYADISDVSKEDYVEYASNVAKIHMHTKLQKEIKNKYKGKITQSKPKSEPVFSPRFDKEILRPIWFMALRNRNRVAYATINGASGSLMGDVPIDVKKLGLVSILVSLVAFLVLQFLCTLSPQFIMGVSLVASFIVWILFRRSINAIYRREIRTDYDKELKKIVKDDRKKRRRFLRSKTGYVLKNVLIALAVFTFPILSSIGMLVFVLGLSVVAVIFQEFNIVFGFELIVFEIVTGIIMLKKIIELWNNHTRISPIPLLQVISSIVVWVISIVKPVFDVWYYGAVVMSLATLLLMMFDIIRDYNLSCSMPLPQFESHKGGYHGINK